MPLFMIAKQCAFALCLILLAGVFVAAQAGETVTYKDGNQTLSGFWAHSQCRGMPRATVLVVHQWKGLGQHEKEHADMLAKECYNAFAVDMYGENIRPKTDEEAAKEAGKYKSDPVLARHRMQVALDFVKTQPDVLPGRIAAIGYCFGGMMALELARSGADIGAVVSFHGSLGTQKKAGSGEIKAKIMAHHGDADPYVNAQEVADFEDEMRSAKADWQLLRYADAVHAFTDRGVGTDPSKGVAYNEKADRRSWAYTLDFLQQVF
mgnify:CR=1 FL=1